LSHPDPFSKNWIARQPDHPLLPPLKIDPFGRQRSPSRAKTGVRKIIGVRFVAQPERDRLGPQLHFDKRLVSATWGGWRKSGKTFPWL